MRPEHSMLRMADRATRRSRVQFGEAIAMMRPANAPRVRHGALSVRVISHSLRLLDWMAIVLAGWVIASWPPAFEVGADMSEVVRLTVFGATLFVVVGETTGAYLLENILSPARFWAPLINAWVVTLLALAAVFLALQSMIDDGGHPFLVSVLIGSSGVITSRALAMPVILRIRRSGAFNTRVAILGTGKQAAAVTRYILNNEMLNITLVGCFHDTPASSPDPSSQAETDQPAGPVLGGTTELLRHIRLGLIDKAIVATPWDDRLRREACISLLSTTPVTIQLAPEWAGFDRTQNPVRLLGDLPVLSVVERPLSGWAAIFKAVGDRLLALVALLVLAPLMSLVAIAIKVDSPGPILFLQLREGYNCKPFKILKFRTMYINNGEDRLIQATRRDPRVTRIGRFLRRTSIDELPQLFNVLSGSMSLVGPRPHASTTRAGGKLFNEIRTIYARRHNVKPGLTGWAQVCGWRGETTTEDMLVKRLEHDLYYIEKCSIGLDIYILLRTAATILFQRTAY